MFSPANSIFSKKSPLSFTYEKDLISKSFDKMEIYLFVRSVIQNRQCTERITTSATRPQ